MKPWEKAPDKGVHEIRDVTGRIIIPVKLLADYQIEGDSGLTLIRPASSAYPIVRRSSAKIMQKFKISVATRGRNTRTLAEVLSHGRPIAIHHSKEACQVSICDIAQFRLAWATAFPRTRVDADAMQRTIWDISCSPADEQEWENTPERTWWDVAKENPSWYDPIDEGWGAKGEGI